jgi:glycosyltransferase 2 family protein
MTEARVDPSEQQHPRAHGVRNALFGVAGIVLGALFLWLALRHVALNDVEAALRQMNRGWLSAAVASYLISIALRCVRWGILLRTTDNVKWRHAAEALLTGFAANYLLPGRVGELFRADYARRIFHMSRFTSLGTIVVERVCDGLVLVCALWLGFAWFFLTRASHTELSRVILVGAAASVVFGAALAFVLLAQRIDVRRFGVPARLAAHWDNLVAGTSSVLRGNARAVVLFSLLVWLFEIGALTCVVRSFGIVLAPPESLMLLGLASLSTLIPTAPAYVGTFQLVFANAFQIFGDPPTIGIAAATAMQIFCFGSVTVLGGLTLLSRSGITLLRARKSGSPAGS